MAAAAEMTRYLISLGHRRIGFIKGAQNQSASAERLIGFETELSQAVPPAEGLIESGEFTYRSGFEAAERLLAARRPRSSPRTTRWRSPPSPPRVVAVWTFPGT